MDRTERQKLGIKRWLANNGRGSLVYGTGIGKTRTAMMAIQLLVNKNPESVILIGVPTLILKEQWEAELRKYNLTENCTVCVFNSIVKKSWNVDLLALDEAHRAVSNTFSQIFDKVNYNFILCLTATMERLDGKESLIKLHAPVCDEITMDEAIENGWISPIKNYLILLNVDLTEYEEANRQFNAYFSFFNFDYNLAMDCLQDYKTRIKYAKEIGSDVKTVLSTAAGWMRALKKRKDFIFNHPKKIEVCRQILDARQDKKCITFCPTIKFAESIKRGVVLHSGKKAAENKKIIEEFNKVETGVLQTNKMANEGIDIKGLSVGIKMNVNSSKITSVQTNGRICRFEEGKEAEMFTLVINNTQELKWFANSNTQQYITITDEEDLKKVLNHEPIEVREREFKKDLKYRF